MEGVGPGTTLDGRYTTQRRIEQRHGAERWTADDTTLGRSVVVLCLPERDHRASALLDAARRAAGLDTPTLQRVLDVGREGGVAWVVEADGSITLGGLTGADGITRMVREVQTAIEQVAAAAQQAARTSAEAGIAASEQGKGAEQLAAAIEEIASLADELQAA